MRADRRDYASHLAQIEDDIANIAQILALHRTLGKRSQRLLDEMLIDLDLARLLVERCRSLLHRFK